MTSLSGDWIGNAYGTNSGNILATLLDDGKKLTGTLKLQDSLYGLCEWSIDGPCGDPIQLNLTPLSTPTKVHVAPGSITAKLMPDGSIEGRWNTLIGTAGFFRIIRTTLGTMPSLAVGSGVQRVNQVYNRTINVGAVHIDLANLRSFFSVVSEGFAQGQLVVTYKYGSDNRVTLAEYFIANPPKLGKPLTNLTISIQEPEPSNTAFNRNINIDLLPEGKSTIRTSGIDVNWVNGKAQTIKDAISTFEDKLLTFYKTRGMDINSIMFVLLLAFAPEVHGLMNRLSFVVFVFLILIALKLLHSKVYPNTTIYLSEPLPGILIRSVPSIISFFASIASAVLAMLLFKWYSGVTPP